MATGQWISEATDQTFTQEVVERSRSTPVLVDFWAPWCGPCRALTPALESAIETRGGRVWLVKVNVDNCPETAQRFQIQGVPAVKAFFNGEVVNEFVGALDRSSLETFIDSAFPSSEDQALDEAAKLLQEDDAAGAEAALQPALESRLHRDAALVLLARSLAAQQKLDEAESTLRQLTPGSPEAEAAQSLLLRFELYRATEGKGSDHWMKLVEASPKDLDARWALAGAFIGEGRTSEGLEQLLEVLMRDRKYRDDGARKVMLSIFEDLGINSELARQFRKQMMIYM